MILGLRKGRLLLGHLSDSIKLFGKMISSSSEPIIRKAAVFALGKCAAFSARFCGFDNDCDGKCLWPNDTMIDVQAKRSRAVVQGEHTRISRHCGF